MSRLHQISRSQAPYEGLAQSVITSNIMFLGDAAMINYSWTSSSGTASRLTLEGYDGDDAAGFRTALPAASGAGWQVSEAVTAQGYHSVDTIPKWGRFLRNPSASSMTLFLTIYTGP